ncbi:carbonic anhydrase family protein [Hydrogenophaga sp. PAMC20947]|uniref:carbonic anhydrase n=1 Tax=Hydrogenophaga sp. PAMC20947 TaxID=2565558 RepID=UPI00109DDDD1|nr:carbonic anhydrase family protein [Hydrogenophaga sp. PAMC20947]QCB46997.1 carbonic anhydrase family protein [Hydrogenophaga sp. PAMC20947]
MKPSTLSPHLRRAAALTLAALVSGHTPLGLAGNQAMESAHAPAAAAAAHPAAAEPAVQGAPAKGSDTISKLKAVIERHAGQTGQVSLRIGDQVIASNAPEAHAPPVADEHHAPAARAKTPVRSRASRDYIRARAAVLSGHAAPEAQGAATAGHGEAHWTYEGDTGPQNWGSMKPDFNTCDAGQRQSPVHILETDAMPGPAEVLRFDYRASGGSVVNNGHTIQVDLQGDNTLYVRGSAYKLIQFHFHHPAEEKVNYKGFSMVAHLVHKNEQGQLAVVAILIDPGVSNPVVEQVWTRMPLDTKDRVGLSAGLIDMNQLLPVDQRYYQFIGSLTTPPCTEGVLWLVMKQPMTVSREQLKLFAHLFPMNARPTQALNGRLVREAM